MIWSLLKVILFVALIAAASFGASLLLDTEGGIRIAVAGWEFTLGPLQATVGALLLLAILWAVMKLSGLLVATLRFLNGDETAISQP
jgi:HemY protein